MCECAYIHTVVFRRDLTHVCSPACLTVHRWLSFKVSDVICHFGKPANRGASVFHTEKSQLAAVTVVTTEAHDFRVLPFMAYGPCHCRCLYLYTSRPRTPASARRAISDVTGTITSLDPPRVPVQWTPSYRAVDAGARWVMAEPTGAPAPGERFTTSRKSGWRRAVPQLQWSRVAACRHDWLGKN